jgi:hypothetical protein
MFNAINYILSYVFNNIPEPILVEAFLPKSGATPNSLDYYIRKDVIEKRVLPDCNLYGGKRKYILLTSDMLEKVDMPAKYSLVSAASIGVYRIPPEIREYRELSHAIELRFPYSASGYATANFPAMISHGQTLTSKANDILDSHTYAHAANPPQPILLNGDLVQLDPPQFSHIDYLLVCTLKYDKNFTNINPDAITPLSELVLSATKNYIYNKLTLQIDRGFLVGGQEFGKFKEIVERYENEQERYKELMLEFRGGATLDRAIFRDVVQGMF